MSFLLYDIVANALAKITAYAISDIYDKLEQPPNSEMGDVAFPCFSFAKEKKKAPQAIAVELRVKLHEQSTTAAFTEVSAVGGYLNFYLNKAEVLHEFYSRVTNKTLLDLSNHSGKAVTIEHTSVNPNASPHIGRARNAMIGDASVRLLRYLGCDVKVHYFVNDIGKQIAMLAYFTKDRVEISFNELLRLYVEANEELKANTGLENEVFQLLNRMESGDDEVFTIFSRIVDICINGQMEIFNEFGIYYDVYDYESRYVKSGKTDEVLSMLQASGKLFEDEDNRLVLNLDGFDIGAENPYLPLTRKDKTSLYPLRDICYNIDKTKENSSRNIVVLGEDQKLYGRQINAALSLIGYKGAEIINYSFVLLPDGKMSTRTGQVILLEDLMRETVEFAKKAITEHSKAGNPDAIVHDERLPKQLAYGAIKYSILKCGNEKNVVFDRESALNFQGDTSVYIQYSFARIQSLIDGERINACMDEVLALTHPTEWEIVKKLLSINHVLEVVSRDFNFSTLCSYLFDLCQSFSRWYDKCPIKNADGALKSARLFLASIIAYIIRDGLSILGIEAPDRI